MAQAMLNHILFAVSVTRSFEKLIEDCLYLIFDSHQKFARAVNSRRLHEINKLTIQLHSAVDLLREVMAIVMSGHLVGYPDLLNKLVELELADLEIL